MKTIILIILSLVFSIFVQEPAISEIRNLHEKAVEQEEAAEKLMQLLKPYNLDEPLLMGYRGAAHMLMAKHVGNPFTKMSHFKKGKNIFTETIEAAPQNVELRFLRFSVQSEAPAFLGYRGNLEEDKAILLNGIHDLENGQLKRLITGYLLSSEAISDAEKRKLRNPQK